MQYFLTYSKRGQAVYLYSAEAYSGPCQASKTKLFVKIINDFQLLTIFAKSSILDV